MKMWKDIQEYEGIYQISNHGEVRSLDRITSNKRQRFYKGRSCTIKNNKSGYKYVTLCKNNKPSEKSIHRLLAIAFIENPYSKKCVNHIDGDKKNNSIANLEWCTYSENTKHAYDNGLISKSKTRLPKCIKFFMKNLYEKGYTKLRISKIIGCSLSTVIRNLRMI